MIEKNRQILTEAIKNLPERNPEPGLWDKIEQFLDFEEEMEIVKPGLKLYHPKENLWDSIEERLKPEDKAKIVRIKFLRYGMAAAATLIIGLLITRYLVPNHKVRLITTYTIENKKPVKKLTESPKSEKEKENLIKTKCSKKPKLCETPEINDLKNELDNLNRQYEKLNDAAERYGNDEKILNARSKIESTKSRIIKELMTKLNS